MKHFKHGSLFSGIGGAELAAEWAGWTNVFHCEINPFGRKILDYYWPKAKSYEDITTADFSIWRGRIDILTGGFPCQPFSLAGKRKGTEDDRNLWPEMLRVIREIKPIWVVGENVHGLLSWDGGVVFEQVQADLEAEAYEVWPVILPACAVNAPHRRDRVWIVAHSRLLGSEKRQEQSMGIEQLCKKQSTPNSKHEGLQGNQRSGSHEQRDRQETSGSTPESFKIQSWDNWPTQPPVCWGDDGLPGKLDGITFPKWRNESIKAFGNAWVPQVAYEIFKVINQCAPA